MVNTVEGGPWIPGFYLESLQVTPEKQDSGGEVKENVNGTEVNTPERPVARKSKTQSEDGKRARKHRRPRKPKLASSSVEKVTCVPVKTVRLSEQEESSKPCPRTNPLSLSVERRDCSRSPRRLFEARHKLPAIMPTGHSTKYILEKIRAARKDNMTTIEADHVIPRKQQEQPMCSRPAIGCSSSYIPRSRSTPSSGPSTHPYASPELFESSKRTIPAVKELRTSLSFFNRKIEYKPRASATIPTQVGAKVAAFPPKHHRDRKSSTSSHYKPNRTPEARKMKSCLSHNQKAAAKSCNTETKRNAPVPKIEPPKTTKTSDENRIAPSQTKEKTEDEVKDNKRSIFPSETVHDGVKQVLEFYNPITGLQKQYVDMEPRLSESPLDNVTRELASSQANKDDIQTDLPGSSVSFSTNEENAISLDSLPVPVFAADSHGLAVSDTQEKTLGETMHDIASTTCISIDDSKSNYDLDAIVDDLYLVITNLQSNELADRDVDSVLASLGELDDAESQSRTPSADETHALYMFREKFLSELLSFAASGTVDDTQEPKVHEAISRLRFYCLLYSET